MIEYKLLNFTDKPITSEEEKAKEINNFGEQVFNHDGTPKVKIIKNNPKAKLRSIAYHAIQYTVAKINEKYNLNLKPYDLFGGTVDSYIEKYLNRVEGQISFLDDKTLNVFDKVFNTEIKFGSTTKYPNFNKLRNANLWSMGYVKAIEDYNKDLRFPLTDACIKEILDCSAKNLNAIFEEVVNVNLMIERNENFSQEKGLIK